MRNKLCFIFGVILAVLGWCSVMFAFICQTVLNWNIDGTFVPHWSAYFYYAGSFFIVIGLYLLMFYGKNNK